MSNFWVALRRDVVRFLAALMMKKKLLLWWCRWRRCCSVVRRRDDEWEWERERSKKSEEHRRSIESERAQRCGGETEKINRKEEELEEEQHKLKKESIEEEDDLTSTLVGWVDTAKGVKVCRNSQWTKWRVCEEFELLGSTYSGKERWRALTRSFTM